MANSKNIKSTRGVLIKDGTAPKVRPPKLDTSGKPPGRKPAPKS